MAVQYRCDACCTIVEATVGVLAVRTIRCREDYSGLQVEIHLCSRCDDRFLRRFRAPSPDHATTEEKLRDLILDLINQQGD